MTEPQIGIVIMFGAMATLASLVVFLDWLARRHERQGKR